jgi:hypothetical protein
MRPRRAGAAGPAARRYRGGLNDESAASAQIPDRRDTCPAAGRGARPRPGAGQGLLHGLPGRRRHGSAARRLRRWRASDAAVRARRIRGWPRDRCRRRKDVLDGHERERHPQRQPERNRSADRARRLRAGTARDRARRGQRNDVLDRSRRRQAGEPERDRRGTDQQRTGARVLCGGPGRAKDLLGGLTVGHDQERADDARRSGHERAHETARAVRDRGRSKSA